MILTLQFKFVVYVIIVVSFKNNRQFVVWKLWLLYECTYIKKKVIYITILLTNVGLIQLWKLLIRDKLDTGF